jgi:short-subunit dehydrogenase
MSTVRRSVVLTGATGGIGGATAAALLRAGGRVLLVARSRTRLARLASALAEHAPVGAVEALAADITSPAGRADIVTLARARDVNALVNCAGVPCFGALDATGEGDIEQVLATNLVAPIQLARALLPLLRGQPGACVLNVGSALGAIGMPGFSVYCASKFGLRGFTEALRRELAGSNVRVQYLAPRATRTPFNDARVDAYNRATGTRSDDPNAVAAAIVRMLQDGRSLHALGAVERIAARVNGIAPRLLDRAFGRHCRALADATSASPETLAKES